MEYYKNFPRFEGVNCTLTVDWNMGNIPRLWECYQISKDEIINEGSWKYLIN
jgi:hypothetical protein